MKILFVLENYHPRVGGLETLFKSLVESLSGQGHQVTVITNHPGGQVASIERYGSLTIRRYRFVNRYLFTFLAIFPAWWYARKADLVHTTSYNAALAGFLAARLSGRRVVVTFHEVWSELWLSLPFFSRFSLRCHYLFERLLLKLPYDRFVAVSQSTAAALESAGVSPSRIAMLYNGLDYDQWPQRPAYISTDRDFSFLYFGRLGISKGLDILIRAVAILSARRDQFRVQLVTAGRPKSLKRALEDMVDKLSIKDFVAFKGTLPSEHLRQLLWTTDCVVVPSYSEGFCFTAVESMASGVPLVCSDRGALPEVVSGRFIIFRPFTPEALAEALEAAMDGKWQESEPRKFPLEETTRRYTALYHQLTEGPEEAQG